MTSTPLGFPHANPSIPMMELPAEQFAPVIHKVSQEDALEQVSLLREHRFDTVGAAEHHSGTHPAYGKCIISIYGDNASIIPFA